MIRHYEKLGFIPEPSRSEGNYRDYSEAEIERLRFVGLAREVGIDLDQITQLLGAMKSRTSARVAIDRFVAVLGIKSSALAELTSLLEKLLSQDKTSS